MPSYQDQYKVNILGPDGRIDMVKAALLKQKVDADRALNFATADPATCTHAMTYVKEGDDIHCHFCDKYLGDASHAD